jgi:hypothetical protein
MMVQSSSRVPWISWGLLAAVAALVALSALSVAVIPARDQTPLIARTWDQFAAQDPEVASIASREKDILGFLGAGFGLLAVVLAVVPFRRGERWAWYALWLFPTTIGAVAARMLIDQYRPWPWYAGITTVALVALLIPIRHFLPSRA